MRNVKYTSVEKEKLAGISPGQGMSIEEIKADTDIADALTKKHSNSSDHAAGSDNQDLSGLQPKETGKGLSTNDLTSTLKTNYDTAYTHSTVSHAPADAQKNSNILKAEIEAVLTGELTSHSHAGGSGGLTQAQILTLMQ